jgi:2-pyrone-4,6-dicarboxylate lactonase
MKAVPAPLSNPSKPEFVLPRGACDTHCHVNGPAAVFPYSDDRRYTPPDAPAERLEVLHAMLGVDRVVFVQATVHGHDNRAMLDAVARAPDRHRGVALVGDTVSAAELKALHGAGVRGVRFNFVRHLGGAPDLAVVTRIAQRIAALGWHLVLHLDAEDLVRYRAFLDTLPVPFVIDHMGRTMVRDGIDQAPLAMLLDLLKDERAWVKLSGPERISERLSEAAGFPYADAVPFARRLLAAAPDRVLWGTDWPHPNVREMPDDGKLVDLLPRYTDDESSLRKLLVDNPTRLYWYD